ncbi:MAG TPA: MBL fold metallo-hydrolase [Ktedonobacteraceae bacterium]|nr:MBL fold metallo-hydrolase [Ktedonobacteraceae bacterium]
MVNRQRFLVRFWGVRGSYPTPGPQTLRYGGNTSCVEVLAGSHILVFDAGSGIIRLGQDLLQRAGGKDLDLTLFLTHAHGDHLIGFPFFAPLFSPRTRLHLIGPQLAGLDIEQILTSVMSPPYFPVDVRQLPSQRTYHTITDEQRVSWLSGSENSELIIDLPVTGRVQPGAPAELCVEAKFTQSHPLNGSICYRIEYAGRRVVYATDVEWRNGCDPAFLAFVEGADLLIHDAQYTTPDYQQQKQGFGHSTVEMAIETAQIAHVRKLILFHHEPTYDDAQLERMEAEAQARFPHTRSAREGMEINLLT